MPTGQEFSPENEMRSVFLRLQNSPPPRCVHLVMSLHVAIVVLFDDLYITSSLHHYIHTQLDQ